jgi:hypothetical protein
VGVGETPASGLGVGELDGTDVGVGEAPASGVGIGEREQAASAAASSTIISTAGIGAAGNGAVVTDAAGIGAAVIGAMIHFTFIVQPPSRGLRRSLYHALREGTIDHAIPAVGACCVMSAWVI